MLVVTRAWNSVTSVAFMRRALALAASYARERHAFGRSLASLPLHIDTLALLEAETRAAFLLAFELVESIGRHESGEADPGQRALLRLLTPIVKLLTARQAVACVSEAIEAFGGAGYIEDTGIPLILRDAQVLPIWEGTTNVLSLDALLRGDPLSGLDALHTRVQACRSTVREPKLIEYIQSCVNTVTKAREWLSTQGNSPMAQASARRFAMTVGRSFELALLAEHAQWQLDQLHDRSGLAAAARFAARGTDELYDVDFEESQLLMATPGER
jgi:hypothetical protein